MLRYIKNIDISFRYRLLNHVVSADTIQFSSIKRRITIGVELDVSQLITHLGLRPIFVLEVTVMPATKNLHVFTTNRFTDSVSASNDLKRLILCKR